MTPKKPAKKAVSAAKTPVKVLSDQEKVKSVFKNSECQEIKNGYMISSDKGFKAPIHSGIAKSEADAWKLAAHNL